jgi:hypothetical protein
MIVTSTMFQSLPARACVIAALCATRWHNITHCRIAIFLQRAACGRICTYRMYVNKARQSHKLTARTVQTAKPGRHGDGNELWLAVSPKGARKRVFALPGRGALLLDLALVRL